MTDPHLLLAFAACAALAVPAAAVLKYLVPKIYQSMRKPKE